MNASTIIMPCNYTGFQDPSTTAGWGVVDFDWSNDLDGWSAATPMNNDERQLIQVKLTKNSPLTPNYTKVCATPSPSACPSAAPPPPFKLVAAVTPSLFLSWFWLNHPMIWDACQQLCLLTH